MVKSPALSGIVEELKNWPGQVLSSHKSARQPFHKISFIAELGFNTSDPGIDVISRKMMEHISEDGIIKLPMNISKSYGVTGSDIWGWTLCDAPVNLYALAKIGLKDDHRIKSGVDSIKSHPYIFYMGNDFRKLKAPLVWYDIIHVLDVISRFNYARQKSQAKEMLDIVVAKQDDEGKYSPESVWQDWKGWDFGQKSQPSKYLTFLVYRILKRNYLIV